VKLRNESHYVIFQKLTKIFNEPKIHTIRAWALKAITLPHCNLNFFDRKRFYQASSLCKRQSFLNARFSTPDLTVLCASKCLEKWEKTTLRIGCTPSITIPSSIIETSEFLLLPLANDEWKYLEFASPSLSECNLDYCQHMLVLTRDKK